MQRQMTFSDYGDMFRRNRKLILILFLVGGPLGYGISLLLPAHYTSTTTVLVQQPTVSPDIVKPVVTVPLAQQLASMQQQILSRSQLEPVIRKYGLYPRDVSSVPMDELVQRLAGAIDVEPVRSMDEARYQGLPGFSIAVTLDDAHTAQNVCSDITSKFIAKEADIRQEYSQDTTQFLSARLGEAKKNLDDWGQKIAGFERAHFGSLPDDREANENELATLSAQLNSVSQALTAAQQDKAFHQSLLDQQQQAWDSSQTGNNPDSLQQQLAKLQSQLQALKAQGWTDDYPDVIETKKEIAAVEAKIKDAENNPQPANGKKNRGLAPAQVRQMQDMVHADEVAITEHTRDRDRINKQMSELEGRLRLSPDVQAQYEALTRGRATANEAYQNLLKDENESSMANDLEKQQQGYQFSVLDPANLPAKPSFPNRPLFAGGGFGLGLALGIGLAFLGEIRDTSLRSERDVEVLLHLPVLAAVPDIAVLPSGKETKLAALALWLKGSSRSARART